MYKMWAISDCICFLAMFMVSVRDIQIRRVSTHILIATGIGSIVYQIAVRRMNLWLILGGIAVGGIFILISRVTAEGIGYGDSIGILILGIYLGFWRVLTVLSVAFFLLLCTLIPILWRKGMSRKYALPFYPFLTAGYLCLLLMERIKI